MVQRLKVASMVAVIAAMAFCPLQAMAQGSALVQGKTADVWVVDPETGQVTGYNTGRWVGRYFAVDYTGINLDPNAVVLVNRLPASSVLMTPGQPEISLLGIGDAALEIGEGGAGGHRDLTLLPASGSYADTIAVVMGVSSASLTLGDHRLTWSAVETTTQATIASGSKVLQTNAGGTGENGYFYETFYLTNTGNYSVSVTLRGGAGATNVSVSADYVLSIAPGKERRDTDGDGIPDSVEADIGLNPFTDDWTADTDGNGWSEFDEWLRRYCLDPNTLLPLDADPACLDADGVPRDSDNDDWADFDEILRGTNHLDPEPVIVGQPAAPPGNMDDADPAAVILPVVPGSEYETQQRLRFKDYPAANRLYEVEHLIDSDAGVLAIPPLANLELDQQSAGLNQGSYKGIVVQSFTPTQDNIAGIDFRVAAGAEGIEDVVLNIWGGSLRDGDLLFSQRLEDVEINGDPDRPIVVRFEAVAVQAGQPVFFEFRKHDVALVTTAADTLGGGGVVEVDGAPAGGLTDLVFSVYTDANFANGIGGTRASMQWWNLAAADLSGSTAYDATTLLRDDEITTAGLLPADIAPRRRMTTLANAFGSSRLPEMRLPAGNSVVLSAVLRNQAPPQDGWQVPADYSRIYKAWLSRSDDVTPIGMLAEQGAGSWTTPDEWRREFIAYLVPRLVTPAGVTLGEASTLQLAVIEAALSEEAALDGSDDIEILAPVYQPGQPIYSYQPGQPVYGNLASTQSTRAATWENHLARLAAGTFNLDQSLLEVAAAINPGMPLEGFAAWLRQRFYAGIPGMASDQYMAQQVRRSVQQSCFVSADALAALQANVAEWNAFLDRCPLWFDETALALQLDADHDRRYLSRLSLLPGAAAAIAGDATLLDLKIDSDADGDLNGSEVEVPVTRLTLPWVADSDNDGIVDGSDPCPLDPYNDCSGNPILPTVVLEDDFVVFEPVAGSDFAIISVQLNRIYDVPVTVCYEALMVVGDTATPGSDFEALSGCVVIAPGQLSALIAIPIFADGTDEGAEWFTVRITSINNATVADDGTVTVTLNDTSAGGAPIIVLANNNIVVNERAAVVMSAVGSTDPAGGALSFAWRQIDNGQPAVTLNGASTAQASFTAPTTLVPVVLIFEVAATNASLLTSTAQVTVTVNPVNDPPFLTGTPFVQVISGNSYEWADETLLAYVSDPENDPLSIGAISQQPSIGSVVDEGGSFTYRSGGGGDLKLSDSQIVEWLLLGTETHVVLNESGPAADFPGTQRVVAVELSTGTRTLLLEGEYGRLLRAAPGSSSLYFTTAANLYRFDPNAAQQLLSAPLPDPFPGAFVTQESAINPHTGDLYYCERDEATNDRNWYRIDSDDLSQNIAQGSCNVSINTDGVKLGDRFCVLYEFDELLCTAPGGDDFVVSHNFNFNEANPSAMYEGIGIRQAGDSVIVFTYEAGPFNTFLSTQVWAVHEDYIVLEVDFDEEYEIIEPRLLLQSPLLLTYNSEPEVATMADGRVVMLLAEPEQSGGNLAPIEMWSWSGDPADATLLQVDIGTIPQVSSLYGFAGKMKAVGNKLYWHVPDATSGNQRLIYDVDPSPGAATPLQLYASVPGSYVGIRDDLLTGSSDFDLLVGKTGDIFSLTNTLATGFATGVCDLVSLPAGQVAQPWVWCKLNATATGIGPLLMLDEDTDGDADPDNLYLLGGGAGATGATSFSVEVTDGEFVIDLPVNIEVLPP